MASTEIARLWKLAQIDNRLTEIRQRAASLDVGQKLSAEVKALEAKEAEVGGLYRDYVREQKDLELANATIADKLKKIEAEMYSGKGSSKDIANLDKDAAAQKKHRDQNDERLMKIMELMPAAEVEAGKWGKALEQRKRMLADRRVKAQAERTQMEAEYKEAAAARPEVAKSIPPGLLARYDTVRQKHEGIGMVQVTVRDSTCSGCGTALPERTIQGLKDDRTMTCEACHRFLYFTEGII